MIILGVYNSLYCCTRHNKGYIRSFYHIIYIGYMEGALLLVRRPRVDVVGVFIDDYTWSIQFIILLYST